MTQDGLPYEEYKGYYLARGITMPSAGVHDWNVYTSIGDVAAENPLQVCSGKGEAIRWVDEHPVQMSGEMKEVRITPEIDELRRMFYDGLKEAHKDEVDAVTMYSNLAGIAFKLGYRDESDALTRITKDESRHRDIVYQIQEKMPPPYIGGVTWSG